MFGINDNKVSNQDSDDPKPLDLPAATDFDASSPPASPPANDFIATPPANHHTDDGKAVYPEPSVSSDDAPRTEPPAQHGSDELLNIKQEALHNLAPLVDKLNQSPEEKFKTTMMLLQASDNPALVKEAYAAANQIKDEKVRAQALLDVVNEINYFTHPGSGVA